MPPSGRQKVGYMACPTVMPATSVGSARSRTATVPTPSTRNSPMWEMSKSPTPVRTSWCSRTSPVYRSGISKPAKSTSLAPAAAWKRWNGVRLRVVAGTRRAPGEETSGRYRMGYGRSRRGAAGTSVPYRKPCACPAEGSWTLARSDDDAYPLRYTEEERRSQRPREPARRVHGFRYGTLAGGGLEDAQLLPHRGEGRDRPVDVLRLVRGRELDTDAG